MRETRSPLSEELTRRLTRWRNTAVPIVQAALAAGLSWLVAVHLVDHRAPFFAPVAAVVCLGITLGQRLRRVIELIVGAGLGVGVGDLLISAIGPGPWQIVLVVTLAMSVAVLLDGGAVITVQSAVSAILMVTLNGNHRSEEHTSELQSRQYIVCRLILDKKSAFLRTTEYGDTV